MALIYTSLKINIIPKFSVNIEHNLVTLIEKRKLDGLSRP